MLKALTLDATDVGSATRNFSVRVSERFLKGWQEPLLSAHRGREGSDQGKLGSDTHHVIYQFGIRQVGEAQAFQRADSRPERVGLGYQECLRYGSSHPHSHGRAFQQGLGSNDDIAEGSYLRPGAHALRAGVTRRSPQRRAERDNYSRERSHGLYRRPIDPRAGAASDFDSDQPSGPANQAVARLEVAGPTATTRPDDHYAGKKAAGRLLDGQLHDAFPEARS